MIKSYFKLNLIDNIDKYENDQIPIYYAFVKSGLVCSTVSRKGITLLARTSVFQTWN